jgi:hypothetical protein
MTTRARRLTANVAAGAALLAIAVALGGCSEKGRSLLLVDLSASQQVTMLANVRVVVLDPGNAVAGRIDAAWSGQTLSLGIYLPKSLSGTVSVVGCGYAGDGFGIAGAMGMQATITPGEKVGPLAMTLMPGTPPAACAATPDGGGGGSGGGGSGGSGGTGGSGVAGTGGSAVAGTGGSGIAGTGGSGVAGTGGTTAPGGRGGAAGSSVGGTGGSGVAGTGGTTAPGGRGGAAGTVGAAGRGGTGGSGVAGSGGASVGGTGGTGPGWRGSVMVYAEPNTQRLPDVAVDSNGNAVVVYQRGSEIWSNKYDPVSGGWGSPNSIDKEMRTTAQSPRVAVDGSGTFLAVWDQGSGSTLAGIWYSTSPDGMFWTPPTSIVRGNHIGPVVAVNAAGAAVVAWTESSGGAYQAVASVRTGPTASWQTQVMKPGVDNGSILPAVGMTAGGQALVAWEQGGGANNWTSVWMNQYSGTSWGGAYLFETYDEQRADSVSIATNRAGGAIVTYIQITAATTELYSRRFRPTTADFAPAMKIGDAYYISSVVPPSVTLDEAGVATVAYGASGGTTYQVYAGRAGPADAAWTVGAVENNNMAADDSSTDLLDTETMPAVRVDSTGTLTLVWRKRVGTRFDLYGCRFSAGNCPAMVLESQNVSSVFFPVLAAGGNGTTVTAWYHANEFQIWANVYR